MKTLRFFLLPTLAGWFTAFAACFALHFGSQLRYFGLPDNGDGLALLRSYGTAFVVGGLLIALPTFLLVILPLSLSSYLGRERSRGSIEVWRYAGFVLVAGIVITATFSALKMTDIGWAFYRSNQAIMFFIPFIPYSLVVAYVAKWAFAALENVPNQSTDPTLASGTSGAGHQPRHP